jgi:2'-hydroxyisoflavone reductase
MKFLIIGGTRFVGRHIAQAAIAAGHEVEVFNRGNAEAPVGAKSLIGDRTRDFTALQTGSWDVVVDACGYRPHEIHAMYDALASRIKKYVFISTVSVYANDNAMGADESANLAPTDKVLEQDPIVIPMNGHTYGPLKVLCEEAVMLHYPNALIIRPTYVVGPDDYTMRYPKWVQRIQSQDVVECPNPKNAPMQYIDVRDLADLTLKAIAADVSGPVNAASSAPGYTFGQFLQETADALNPSVKLNWIDAPEDGDFPLWTGGELSPMLGVDNSRALSIGLTPRPLAESAHAVAEWLPQE